MANYTPNYQLHQWEPEDSFLRTDFNEDLKKIDTVLHACGFAIGSYIGTNGAGQDIHVGFEPSAVIIGYPGGGSGDYGTFITRDQPSLFNEIPLAKITADGFHVQLASYDGHAVTPYTDLGGPYVYVAFQ